MVEMADRSLRMGTFFQSQELERGLREASKEREDLNTLRLKHSSGMAASTSAFVGYRFFAGRLAAAPLSLLATDGRSSRSQLLGTAILSREPK